MRKRNVQILIRMTEEEAAALTALVKRSGRSREDFIRQILAGYQLHEKPDAEFYRFMDELSRIGNNLNQLARIANAIGTIDPDRYRNEVERLRGFQQKIAETYLLPRKHGNN